MAPIKIAQERGILRLYHIHKDFSLAFKRIGRAGSSAFRIRPGLENNHGKSF